VKDANEAMQEAKEKEKAFEKEVDAIPENIKKAFKIMEGLLEKKRKENL